MMGLEFHDIIGFVGGVFILVTYFLLQTKKMSSDNLLYSVLNLVGALMILYSLINAWNLTAGIIEVIWVFLSIFGIFKWQKNHAQKNFADVTPLVDKKMPPPLSRDQKRA